MTSNDIRSANAAVMLATCVPNPPQILGGYSELSMSVLRIRIRNLVQCHSKPDREAGVIRARATAVCTPRFIAVEIPAAAANHPLPWTSFLAAAVRIIGISIEQAAAPLPDISAHVRNSEHAVALWRERSDPRWPRVLGLHRIASPRLPQISPRPYTRIGPACRPFPLRLRRQPAADPVTEDPCVMPRHQHDRMIIHACRPTPVRSTPIERRGKPV